MALRERTQNPVIGDTVKLRLFVYNSNHRQDVHEVTQVEIYFLDPELVSESNPDGRRLIETIPAAQVTHEGEGEYSVTVTLDDTVYTIGDYRDVWEAEFEEDQPVSHIENRWCVLPDLWYAGPEPILYDFSFGFRPNRIRYGSKQYLTIDVRPNVPTAPDLERYYKQLAIASPVKVYIEMHCGPCVPKEQDLRMIVDGDSVPMRTVGEAYYFLDTVALDMDCAIYNIWFGMEFGDSTYLSEKLQLQIFN
jgi:hypothetical protein